MAEPEAENTFLTSFFDGFEESRMLFDFLHPVITAMGDSEMMVRKTQIAFRRKRGFAWVWIPEKHLGRKAAPLVLSLAFPGRDPSPRWKEIIEPARGRFMHHLEIASPAEIDEAVKAWLRAAYDWAG